MLNTSFKSPAKGLLLAFALLLLNAKNQSPPTLIAAADIATSTTTSSYYTAGVAEFRPTQNTANALEDNLAGYLELINSAAAASTDIIVFPESTLNSRATPTFVPDPIVEVNTIPCLLGNTSIYSDFLVQLSCSARQARKYVVINVTERENCTTSQQDPRPCASNGFNIFNTNVVFDREGRIISRYRKWNLYGEPSNTTYNLELGIFDTDFGVRFGHFICFDVLFYQPAQSLIDLGIRDVVFPTMWFSQLPFLTGVQFQQSWAYINDVNFLAAGSSLPAIGSTGSGIYAGRKGALVTVMNTGNGERRLYVAQVPKLGQNQQGVNVVKQHPITTSALRETRLNQADILLKRDYLEQYKTILVHMLNEGDRMLYTVRYKTFVCHFDLTYHQLDLPTTTRSQYYTYRVGAYAGMRDEPGAESTNAIRNCAIFACTGPEITDCGRTFASNVTQQPQIAFDRIVIESDFPAGQPSLLMPNSLLDDLLPLAVNEFDWVQSENEDGSRHVRYTLNKTTPNLLAFAIFGNFFDDVGPIEEPSTSSQAPATVTTDGVGILIQPTVLMLVLVGLLRTVFK